MPRVEKEGMSSKSGKLPGPSLLSQVERRRRQKLAQNSVVNLADYRKLAQSPETKTILIVDDEEVMRNALKRMLESEGYRTILARDGMELSRTLETMRLDLVLLDINLPWVDGFELCQMIKAHPSLQKVPLVLISGRSAPEDIARGIQAGANGYLAKPFDLSALTELLNQLIAGGKGPTNG